MCTRVKDTFGVILVSHSETTFGYFVVFTFYAVVEVVIDYLLLDAFTVLVKRYHYIFEWTEALTIFI